MQACGAVPTALRLDLRCYATARRRPLPCALCLLANKVGDEGDYLAGATKDVVD